MVFPEKRSIMEKEGAAGSQMSRRGREKRGGNPYE